MCVCREPQSTRKRLSDYALPVRVQTWNELTGRNLRYVYMDLAEEYDGFLQLIKDEQPDTMVHFAEQVAARHSTVWPSHV